MRFAGRKSDRRMGASVAIASGRRAADRPARRAAGAAGPTGRPARVGPLRSRPFATPVYWLAGVVCVAVWIALAVVFSLY